jgi:hypothetical protein
VGDPSGIVRGAFNPGDHRALQYLKRNVTGDAWLCPYCATAVVTSRSVAECASAEALIFLVGTLWRQHWNEEHKNDDV